ncbi:MAG TPA: 3-deoxy-D-manno-octulosonic acid transferase [Blastocatellia bacterium]|nr:3-deoxy-D-manno-octulosonic acid transferase [Blastocatellia bacterium]
MLSSLLAAETMYVLYSLALAVLFVVLLPYFIYQAIKHGKYKGSFKQRMGRLPQSLASDERETVWVHAVSVGEFQAARPLIERLRRLMPETRVVVSTITLTGQRLARSHCPSLVDGVFYFPFDFRFAARRSLMHVKPSIVVIMETELWPNFLRECQQLGAVTVVANGRISQRSFSRYRRVGPFIRRVLRDISLLVMQSEADADRARSLGALSISVRVCGNLKYDAGDVGLRTEDGGLRTEDSEEGRRDSTKRQSLASIGHPRSSILHPQTTDPHQELDDQFALALSPYLIVAGSTAPGEERILLDALREVRGQSGLEAARLVIAPRHPERFEEVAELIARSGFAFARRSRTVDASSRHGDNPRTADVVLLDSIGELQSVYAFASVVFVGGSLVSRGGHNVIEPAAFARPIIVGPYTENFEQIVDDFLQADAIVKLDSAGEASVFSLARELGRLLSDRKASAGLGERARNLLASRRGTVECTVAAIKEVFTPRSLSE